MKQQSDSMVIEARALSKVFRDFWGRPKAQALKGIDFRVGAGEVFGLLGPNGSGKSTTIRIILGLLRPTSGYIRVLDHSPSDVMTKARIGYMPEESTLYRYLTPVEALMFYGRLFGLDRATCRDRIDQLLEMTDLQDARNRIVGEFSKGMARRLALAQALINNPDLVLLDEPTSGLDPIGCRQFKDLILELARQGKTVLLSSHLLADAEDVCSRIAVLHNGSVCAMGAVRDLLEERKDVTLALPSPEPDSLKAIVDWIRKETGRVPRIDHPTRTLEQFFLDVIQQAREDARGRQEYHVADFLRTAPPRSSSETPNDTSTD